MGAIQWDHCSYGSDRWQLVCGEYAGPEARAVPYVLAALDNAQRFGLSEREADIIGKHMWPLTMAAPRYAESFWVGVADKLAASLEMLHLFNVLGVRRNLVALESA